MNGHSFAFDFACPRQTDSWFGASAAGLTKFAVYFQLILDNTDGLIGTHIDTPAADCTLILPEHEDRLYALGFGILAPKAAQGASLQKYRGAYARPIMGRKALDIENLPDKIAILCKVHYNHLIVGQVLICV